MNSKLLCLKSISCTFFLWSLPMDRIGDLRFRSVLFLFSGPATIWTPDRQARSAMTLTKTEAYLHGARPDCRTSWRTSTKAGKQPCPPPPPVTSSTPSHVLMVSYVRHRYANHYYSPFSDRHGKNVSQNTLYHVPSLTTNSNQGS